MLIPFFLNQAKALPKISRMIYSGHWRLKTALAKTIFNPIQLILKKNFFPQGKQKSQFSVSSLLEHCAIKINESASSFNRNSLKKDLVTTTVNFKNKLAEFPLTLKCYSSLWGQKQQRGVQSENQDSTILTLCPESCASTYVNSTQGENQVEIHTSRCMYVYGAIPRFQNALFNKSWYSLLLC